VNEIKEAIHTLRYAIFWDITRRCVIIVYRRFGIMYRSHLQGSRVPEEKKTDHLYRRCRVYVAGGRLSFLLGLLSLEDGIDTLSRNVGKQLPHDAE
jgi:hypothetical protein